jgi:hypothetical protein
VGTGAAAPSAAAGTTATTNVTAAAAATPVNVVRNNAFPSSQAMQLNRSPTVPPGHTLIPMVIVFNRQSVLAHSNESRGMWP